MLKKNPVPKKALFLGCLSFLIPLCILVVCLYVLKITPFGDDSLLLIDSASQYVNYLGYFRSVLLGENDLFYTFSKNLGGDLLSLAAYYMLSPFNLLFLLADLKTLPLAFTAIMVLKLSCCGLSYYCASAKFFGHKVSGLIFSTAYALMGYNLAYCWNIMWLDGVMILPLLFLGLYRLVTEGKLGLYAVSIAYALVTSFYTGYMLCAASVLLFLALLGALGRQGQSVLRLGGRFVWGSCIGGFAAAPVWLPAVLTLGGNRTALSGDAAAFSWKTNLLDFTAKLVPGSVDTMELYEGMPHVFCGTLVLLLAAVFFANPGIARRVRLSALAVVLVFLASFCLSPLDVAWHGFSPNRLFNFRYSFLFSFVLILMGQYSLHHLPDCPARRRLLWGLPVPAAAAIALLRQPELAVPGAFVTLALLIPLLLCLRLDAKKWSAAVLTVITLLELGVNCGLTWDKMCEGTLKLTYTDYYYYVDSVEPAIREAKNQEEDFYRIEKTFFRNQNDPMLFSYNGLSHFSSTEPGYVMEFLEKMGLRNYFDVWSAYLEGSTADVDALLGVRYLLSNEDQTVLKGYELVSTPYGIGLYRNPNALPLAMLADNALLEVSTECRDYFALHNAIWSGLTGEDQLLLLKEPAVTLSPDNLRDTLQSDGTHLYTRIDPARDASLRFEISISQEMPLYCYFTAPAEEQPVTLWINGEPNGAYFDAFRWNMVCTGTYAPGKTLVVELKPDGDSFVFDEGWFYYEDRAALARAAAGVKENPVTLTQLSASRFTGSFTCDSPQTLFFTIPFDEGWQLTLDGEKIPMEMVLDTFLALPVEAGEHSFQLRFLPRGLTAGGALTAVSALMTLGWVYASRRKRRVP